jgi:adenosylhomocysteine nucleosidase
MLKNASCWTRPVVVAATFALDAEFAPWRRRRPFRQCANQPVPVYETRIGDARLRVVLTGIGRRAATAAAAMVFQDRPDVCLASGLAGGLSQALRVADIIAAGRVRGPDGRTIDSDPRLLALAVGCGARAVSTLYSSDTIVVSGEQKRRLSVVADAVDMESTTILGECHDRGVPGIAIRAISDPASADLPLDFNSALTNQGRFSMVRMMGALARRPQAVAGLVRFGVESRRAAAALSLFLDAFVEQLAANDYMQVGEHRTD